MVFVSDFLSTLEMMLNSTLLHNRICSMSRFDFSINCKIGIANRTVPDIMISFAVPDKRASILFQQISDLFFVFSHNAPVRVFLT